MSNDFIMIPKARVSFPHLFTPPVINGEEGKCGAVLMLDPATHAAEIKKIEDAIAALCKEKNKGRKLPSDKLCLRDGDDKGRSEYEGLHVLSANSRGKPLVLRGDGKTRIEEATDSAIYAGCFVNAKIRLWFQDNQYGKRVNAELVAIQFAVHGAALDGTYISEDVAAEGFGTVDADDDMFAA